MMDERTETRAETFRERTTGASVELPYAGIDTFLKSSLRSPSDVAGVDAAVLGVPYDGAVSNRPGTRYGPGAIREASAWWAYLSGYKGGLTNMRTGREVDFGSLGVVCVYHPQTTKDSVLRGGDELDDETEERLNAALWQYNERVATLIEAELDEFVRRAEG